MHDFAFDLEPRFRHHLVIRGMALVITGALAGILGIVNGSQVELVIAAPLLVGALLCAGLWTWRARFGVLITREGIEARRYVGTKRIPWSEVRDIQTYYYNRSMPMRVVNGRAGRSRNSSGGGTKLVACVRIVRVTGRRIQLPAPLVTRGQSDPHFAEKVRTMKAVREAVRTGTGFTAPAVQAAQAARSAQAPAQSSARS